LNQTHLVAIPPEEERLLAALVGRPLDLVRAEVCGVEVVCGDLMLDFSVDEVPTPGERNPHADANRVAVSQPEWGMSGERERWTDLGTVVEVAKLRVRSSTSLPADAGAIRIRNELRPSMGWNIVYLAADEESKPGLPLIISDVGVEIVTDRKHRVLIYCFEATIFIGIAMDATPEMDWIKVVERVSIARAAPAV